MNIKYPFLLASFTGFNNQSNFRQKNSFLSVLTTHCLDFSLERFHAMQSCPGTYFVIVIEDVELAKIVACGTLVVEQKFIHDTAVVCYYTQTALVESFHNVSFLYVCTNEAIMTGSFLQLIS